MFLAGGAAEGVDAGADGDVGEAGVFEHLLPARTGQPARYSSGPQIDVVQGFGWYWVAVGDISELQRAAGTQHAVDLGEHGALVGAQVDGPVGDDDVRPAITDRQSLGERLAEIRRG